MAFPHVDDAMRLLGVEAKEHALPDLERLQRRPTPAFRRRQMGIADDGLQCMLRKRRFDPRYEIAAIGLVVCMLELAATALREVAARRVLMMRPEGQRAIVENRVAGHAKGYVAAA